MQYIKYIKVIAVAFGVILVIFITLLDWHFPKITSKHRDANRYENFYEMMALRNERADFCDRISPLAFTSFLWDNPSGKRILLHRSDCYHSLAVNTRNADLCRFVQPVNSWFFNGSKISEAECRKAATRLTGVIYSSGAGPREEVEALLNEMGLDYTSSPLYLDALKNYSPDSAFEEYWFTIITTPDFIERALRLPVSAP